MPDNGWRFDRFDKNEKVVRLSSIVRDYAYERGDNCVYLSFTYGGNNREGLGVRLFECNRGREPERIADEIRRRVEQLGEEPGFAKSSRCHDLAEGETLAAVARAHGHRGTQAIFEHERNQALRAFYGTAEKVPEGTTVFVPQVNVEDVLPLGERMDCEEVTSEEVASGARFRARWDVEQSGYDPLVVVGWAPEALGSPFVDTADEPSSLLGSVYLPRFAVLDEDNRLLGVAPAPPRLANEVTIEGGSGAELAALFWQQESKALGSEGGQVQLARKEEPLLVVSA